MKDAAKKAMTWEEKWLAMAEFAEPRLALTRPGVWFLRLPGLEVGGDGLLRSVLGTGQTPELAVEDAWSQLTTIPNDRYLVIHALGDVRKHYRWSGFMWKELPR